MSDAAPHTPAPPLRRPRLAMEVMLAASGVTLACLPGEGPGWLARSGSGSLRACLPTIVAWTTVWTLALVIERTRSRNAPATMVWQWLRLGGVASGVLMLVTLGRYSGWPDRVEPEVLARALVLSYVLVGLGRSAVQSDVYRRDRASRAIVIGAADAGEQLRLRTAARSRGSLDLVGRLALADAGDSPRPGADRAGSIPLLGTAADLPRVLEQNVVDEVIVVPPPAVTDPIVAIVEAGEIRGIDVQVVVDLPPFRIAHAQIGQLNGLPTLTFTTPPHRATKLLVKRMIDIGVTIALLPAAVPLLLALMAILLVTGTRSPVFRQERVARNGRLFTMFKLRTMHEVADTPTDGLRDLNKLSWPAFKAPADPRVTRFGRFLRRWSLDELPQLLNVLKGEMSLVGPRPALPKEVRCYEPWQRRRLSMSPGMTGLWQVSGRCDVDFEEWMRLDLEYIDNWSIRLDLRILGRTIPTVLTGRGAL